MEEMAYQVVCKDLGTDCDFVAKSESIHDLLSQLGRHSKQAHGYTDAQLQDPKKLEQLLMIVKHV